MMPTMRSSRRVLLCLAATVVVAAGCGSRTDSTAAPVDTVAAGQPAATDASDSVGTEAATGDAAVSPSMKVAWQTFEFSGEYPTLATSAPTWTLPTGVEPDPARIQAIAAAFGVTGELQMFPADQGEGWFVGSSDFSTASIRISKSALLDWYFSAAVDPTEVVDVGCGGVAMDVPPDSSTAPCDATSPTPPAGVPTATEAEAKTRELLTAAGFDLNGYTFDVTADDWGAYVTARPSLGDGVAPYELSLSVGFGGGGVVNSASGSLATPVPAEPTELITPADGVARLNEQVSGWEDSPMAREYDSEVVIESGAPAVENAAPMPVDPMPVDPMPVEPTVVTFAEVSLGSMVVWPGEGDARIVPAYLFRTADGGEYSVEASLEATVYTNPDATTDSPMPVEPPVEVDMTEIPTADAQTLLGLSEADAEAAAAGYAWGYRVVARDGEQFAITMDYSPTRVNVTIEAGVVTAVYVG